MKSFILPVEFESAKKYLLDLEKYPTWSSNFVSCIPFGDKYLIEISASQLVEKIEVAVTRNENGMKISGTGNQLVRNFELYWELIDAGKLEDGTPQTRVEYEFSLNTKFPTPSFMKNAMENKFISQIIQDVIASISPLGK